MDGRGELQKQTVSELPSWREGNDERLLIREWNATGEWLRRYQWDHFFTGTFAHAPLGVSAGYRRHVWRYGDHLTTETVSREFLRWVRCLERTAQHAIYWARGVERGPAGRLHAHALVRGTAEMECTELARAWRCGLTDVQVYNPELGATRYLAKAIGSDPLSFDFRLPLRSL